MSKFQFSEDAMEELSYWSLNDKKTAKKYLSC